MRKSRDGYNLRRGVEEERMKGEEGRRGGRVAPEHKLLANDGEEVWGGEGEVECGGGDGGAGEGGGGQLPQLHLGVGVSWDFIP